MSYRDWWVEKEWTLHGMRCLVTATTGGWRCGYVVVPESHPWHGRSYNDKAPTLIRRGLEGKTIDGTGYIAAFCASGVEGFDGLIEGQIEAYMGLTFGGQLSEWAGGGWAFGFDCNHCDDAHDREIMGEREREIEDRWGIGRHGPVKDAAFVEQWVNRLADQLVVANVQEAST